MSNEINAEALYGAWEVPLLVVSSELPIRREDYRKVFDFVINDKNHEVSSLVRRKAADLESALKAKILCFEKVKRYANRPFVELYLDRQL